MELNKLIENVQQWSIDRGLDKADSKKQILKLYEEFGELASGIAKNKPGVIMDSIGDCVVVLIILAQQMEIELEFDGVERFPDNIFTMIPLIDKLTEKVLNSEPFTQKYIGLLITTLIRHFENGARLQGYKFEDCLEMAWNAIKDRKGKLINGIWVKEEDLPGSKSPEQTLGDVVNKPSHYFGSDGLEVREIMRQFAPCPEYIEGGYWTNVAEYFFRAYKKNGVEDLKKARKNLDWLIEELENGQKNQN